jgi:hypothetical protein
MLETLQQEGEARLREIFEENFEFIRAEGGHSITNFIKEEAYLQVLCYFRKNIAIIDQITESEVKLTLPGLKTPEKKRTYNIEGVVDIIREGDEVWMYDLKTHDRFAIENNKPFYREQLNVYAHIYKRLMGNRLDNTAIISTALPGSLKGSLRAGVQEQIAFEMQRWDPVIPLGYSEEEVEAMIDDFGRVVDAIEDHEFAAPPVERLLEKDEGGRGVFATRVCRNCDARFSCPSYREYARQSDSRNQGFRKYFDDYGTDYTTEEFIEGNLPGNGNLND